LVVVVGVVFDPVVVDAARRFFRLPTSPRLHVHTGDGVPFLARARAGYDIVLLDAFSAEGIPAALTSKAFFSDARRVLADRGVAVLNIALVSPPEMELITLRFAEAFPGCVVVTGKAEDNRVLFGARVPVSIDGVRVAALMSKPTLGYDAHADVEEIKPCPSSPK
jgi:spermidine synthase